jgi:type III pantothenate kinase
MERPEEKPPLLGSTTRESIQSGVVNGLVFEIDGFIEANSKNYPKLQVVLTGGDAKYFVGKLKNSIFVDLNLNLIGLNRILEHNAIKER